MFPKYRSEGFLFKAKDFRESDRIYSFFTKDFGRVDLLGRGVRKIKSKLRGYLKLFDILEIEFVQGKLYRTLTDANSLQRFSRLRKDPERLKIAFKISELMDTFLKGEEREEKIWLLIKEVFSQLNRISLESYFREILYYYFFWNFLSLIGYKPNLEKCSLCSEKISPSFYFSAEEGGIICQKCFQKDKKGKPISRELLKLLRIILEKDLNFLKKVKIKEEYLEEIKDVSQEYLDAIS